MMRSGNNKGPAVKVTVATDRPNKRYVVRVEGNDNSLLGREYVWGDFDEGMIYPQRARADAWAYAEYLAQRLGCRWHVTGR